MKPREPNRVDSIRVAELSSVEVVELSIAGDGTAETVDPTSFIPTVGANCHGLITANPMVRYLGFRVERDMRSW